MLFTYGAWGLAYHERLKNPPKSFAEFVDGTIKGKWRAALPNSGYTGTPQILIWSLAEHSAAVSTMSSPPSMPSRR